jgi:hypothetical protein
MKGENGPRGRPATKPPSAARQPFPTYQSISSLWKSLHKMGPNNELQKRKQPPSVPDKERGDLDL